ncbi:valine--tRNA ligase [Oceanithermus desulfurans]|uniref:Valine--tRNA ligase n=2 Tax=Oceanithermus desulfurans TaxID=227924 RepID=A0A511RH88_9DEIN|nr:valine--tRNA ligase [Oceanithermus desulfurans]MBB6028938.1 valyl-tRNA synthetase [Oceanithermus desulfurans]GEM88995.1 valine--tRNA ligase [Oceanithermus desulfurans NBRC 100063]
MKELSKAYDPHQVEPRWAERWAERPFVADPHSGKPPFVIVMPPPNVTGVLHMGHALDNALQDALIRYKRLRGYEAVWLPGTDHAGIATQVVVERLLAKEGQSRHELGREKFLERVWRWREESGGQILEQLKRLGASADWSRLAFTMDETRSRAVRYAFVRYHHEGLIYRGERLLNWCPRCETTLSDLEVNNTPTQGTLYTIAYPLEGGGEIRIATVRPETIFADVAIAVHPEDERYKDLIGKKARIPLTEIWIPVIADEAVEREFGTGALKITPAHDPTDYEIGHRHGLPEPSVIDLEGKLVSERVPERFRGLDRFEARKAVARALEEEGYLRATEPYQIALATCDRCGTAVEYALFPQWWLKMKPLADEVLPKLKEGDIRFYPERWRKVNIDWFENIRDWNISRQLWWGHQIPAWYCPEGHVTVPELETFDEDPKVCATCGSPELERDPDVLDTWFSSALWPLSTLGWPEDTEDYRAFYPTSVLVTGYDILFLWVSRMEVSGYHFDGRRPFEAVMLHGLVLDEKGKKMSKSKGNVVDPLELVEAYGADALRFALIHLATGGQDIRFDRRWVEMGRNFANKLWNAARFVFMNREGFEAKADAPTLADRWMAARLREGIRNITQLYDAYDLALASREVYQLVWSEFCDWYIEAAKPALRSGNAATLRGLETALEALLKLLHPFMPFVTSEIYTALKQDPEAELALAEWPAAEAFAADPEALAAFKVLQDAVTATRSLRAELGLPPQQELTVHAEGPGAAVLLENADFFRFLARAEVQQGRPQKAVSAVTPQVTVWLELEGLVDVAAWKQKQQKKAAELERRIAGLEKKLANPGFTERAPAEVVERERRNLEEAHNQLERIRQVLARF